MAAAKRQYLSAQSLLIDRDHWQFDRIHFPLPIIGDRTLARMRAGRAHWANCTLRAVRIIYPLLAVCSLAGCVSGAARPAARSEIRYAPVELPAQLDDKAYRWRRGLYDALPLGHPQRAPFRARLHRYLVAQASSEFERDDAVSAAKTLLRLASLYDPARVHRSPPEDEELYRLAGKVVAAFSPRGDIQRVVPALSIQIGLRPNERRLQERLKELLRWVDESSQALHGRGVAAKRPIDLVERAMMIWPSRFVIDTLYRLYLRRTRTLAELSGGQSARRRRALRFAAMHWTGYNVVRMYVWVDQVAKAAERLPATSTSRRDDVLRRLVSRAAAQPPAVSALLQLATLFEQRDPRVALRLCRRATVVEPKAHEAHACVGRLAAATDQTALAVSAYTKAYEQVPASKTIAERLARQYQRHLFMLIETEQLQAAEQSVEQIEHFYAQAEARVGKRLQPPLSKVRFALGFGQYNAGHIDDARKSLQKSLESSPSPEALVQLATIARKEGRHDDALALLDRAKALDLPPTASLYWRARTVQLRAHVLGDAQKRSLQRAAQRTARDLWDEWLSLDVPPEAMAEGHLRLATTLYDLGRVVDALDALDRAIDVEPARKETYADAIAMLATRGHLPEAQDVLHRALGRPEVTEYLKTYCSFWVVGLARRTKQPPDPLALRYLDQLKGNKWFHKLAHFVAGKLSFEKLQQEADTEGKRAELHFYRADQLLASGQLAEARKLWRKVLATKMMAFFEYDMAAHNLRHGPAKVSTQLVDRHPDAH
jgi:tetratricopeptide (TPR) repeat protein